jgi:hypothetical protein
VSTTAPGRVSWSLGTVGAVLGLALALVAFAARVLGDDLRPPPAILQAVALAVIVVPPSMLALAAVRFDAVARAGVWLGIGVLTLLLGLLTLISGIGIIFLVFGLMLVIGGAHSLPAGSRRIPRFLVTATVVAAAGVLAPIVTHFLFSPTPQCWESREGVWRRVPLRGGGTIGYGSPGVVGTCTSDTETPLEVGLAASVWLVAGTGVVLLNRRGAA